jgi:hypothetical protein
MKYIFDKAKGCMVEKDTGKPTVRTNNIHANYYISSDIDGFRSPMTNKWVPNRYARSEEMKRENVREVDPSEKDTIARMQSDE